MLCNQPCDTNTWRATPLRVQVAWAWVVNGGKTHHEDAKAREQHGMCRADNVHHSLRDVCSKVLMRRTPVVQHATGSQIQPNLESQTTRASPAEGVEPELYLGLIQAGLPRQRMNWTKSVNENNVFIFYEIITLGQETMGYKQQLHAKLCRKHPQIEV